MESFNNCVLVGNPNSGKTSLFNRLTGLRQKVGNYPGVTVDKREGTYQYDGLKVRVLDVPGIYSLFPSSEDERIAVKALLDLHGQEKTIFLAIIDVESVEKNLVLLSQLMDFGMPIVGVFNYRKSTTKEEINEWLVRLSDAFDIPWYAANANTGEGVSKLKEQLSEVSLAGEGEPGDYFEFISKTLNDTVGNSKSISQDLRKRLEYIDEHFTPIAENTSNDANSTTSSKNQSKSLDKWLMHSVWGYVIFIVSLLVIFQAVFAWAAYPMEWIDIGFAMLGEVLSENLPSNFFTNAITQGIIPGLAGVVIFIPQIAFLFLFIALFEESGYMTRVVYLMDRLVKPFGLSGRSVVPLISGYACAIPAIMATRTIKHPREKLITMLVIPFMTCSARIPVYTTLIALMVPQDRSFGPFNAQGLMLLAMYLFGAFFSFFAAWVTNRILSGGSRSLLLMELPNYKLPNLKNIGLTVYEKSRSFVVQAGKVILAVSLVLYFMANIGFTDTFQKIEDNDPALTAEFTEGELAKLKLENSLIGQLGKTIEPAIAPLGYDWKIGISLITSFAAREVFVGTMATIYALEEQTGETSTIVSKMRADKKADGTPKYTLAVVLSLLVFYALALQCLSTVAVMAKETGGWKWPIIQLIAASVAAYSLAFIVCQLFS